MIHQKSAGGDISKLHIDLCILIDGEPVLQKRFDNTPSGIAALITHVRDHQVGMLVYEPSGFERAFALALAANDVPARRVNARQVRHFIKGCGGYAKTDRIDALMLARFAASQVAEARPPLDESMATLQALYRRRTQLVEHRKREKQHLSACQYGAIADSIKDSLVTLQAQIARLDQTIAAFLKSHPALARKIEILTSMPGVGPVTALGLLAEMPELGQLTRRATACLAGLAPHPWESGGFKAKSICWGGRKPVRNLLYMGSLTAARGRGHYTRLITANKPHKVAAVAIMRHMVETANALIRKNQTYTA